VDDRVRPALVGRHLDGEVDVFGHPGELEDAAELNLTPAAADRRRAEGLGEGDRRLMELRLGLSELA